MRVWEKNFLITVALFAVLFFASVFVVVSTSYHSALNSERETTLREEALLARALQEGIGDIEGRANPSPKAVPALVASYAPAYGRKGIYLQITQNDEVLFGNLPVNVDIPGETQAAACTTLAADGAHYLTVTDTLTGISADYPFVYLKDISALYVSQQKQATLLICLAAAVSAAFAALLYLTLRHLYRPIDNLAHELRSPLTSIRGYAEYLQTAAITEEEHYSATDYIIGESRRLSDICDRLLVLANIREGEIAMEKVDIEALFERVQAAYRCVEYETSQRFVYGDAALLQSLVSNLVSNAVKASPESTPVTLSFRDNILEVRDSGSGMSAQMAAQLSKPSYKPAGSQQNGNGLGIPLCHQIARAHHAQLVFSSSSGNGTSVRVIFYGSETSQ